MTKAVNDATLNKAGDIYQYLITLKDCFGKLLLCVALSFSLSACAESDLNQMYIEEAQ